MSWSCWYLYIELVGLKPWKKQGKAPLRLGSQWIPNIWPNAKAKMNILVKIICESGIHDDHLVSREATKKGYRKPILDQLRLIQVWEVERIIEDGNVQEIPSQIPQQWTWICSLVLSYFYYFFWKPCNPFFGIKQL